jgi:heme oxygenase
MSASKDNLHERLRRATRPLHDELERAVGIGEQIATRERYRVYLSRLWALHVAAETAIAAFDFSPLRFAYPEHYRSRLLADDLATVGVRAEQLRLLPLPQAPRLHCVAAALGAVYVVEGSAKGARAILPQIAASLGYDARQGASFFAGFGRETAALWHACLAAINGIDPNSAEADQSVEAAKATFAMFRRGLAPDTQTDPVMSRTADVVLQAVRT